MPEANDAIQVMVELEREGEPVRGVVRTDAGSRPFDGWMEFTAAIEHARTARHRDGPPTKRQARSKGGI